MLDYILLLVLNASSGERSLFGGGDSAHAHEITEWTS